ncbi:MAG TPA: lysophospholipid acyltransferase family protein [Actinophytocola sp.]|uniref:lysophospholipid acyltransferase family protein n=1 Tax=Actinophytocola sp. TaxID=1872138 RepID=UPI002DBBED91|nr:lysophospholipid acyltransferase family protein [Actinophytocola sp.]HEU5473314.1 lysophospholipid acyltransferase family protein [Actinophytocola sp.]
MPSPVRRACEHLVRRGLRGVWLRGRPPAGPFVWAANHHSWWDPFVAAAVVGRLGRAPAVLMEQDNLRRFGVARLLGAFGTAQLRQGLHHLRRGRVLIIFPEGVLRPPARLAALADGAAWYARRAEIPLCAVAARIVLRGHQAPEAYLDMSTVDTSAPVAGVTARLEQVLAVQLGELDRSIATSDPRRPLPGFTPYLEGRRSWDERWSRD